MAPFVITGAEGGSTAGAEAPNRLEISDFVKDEKFFSLYIQALAAMSAEDQDALKSFFQIGGIHGLPYAPWNGSGDKDKGGWAGYCTHGSMLFPTWHRPYVAVYEQLIQKHAIDIAKTYTHNTDSWKKAAANLRTPYWDWASKPLPPDEVIAMENVSITKPDGTKKSVPNPLYHYKFHPVPNYFPSNVKSFGTTVRHPSAKDPVKSLKDMLNRTFPTSKDNTYDMLTRLHDWIDFSNHTSGNNPIANSLESVHDNIHVYVGQGGHMNYPTVAGFDPIFFLHHANVDRLLSLWSALNPDVWVSEGPAGDGTWTIPPTATVGPDTALTPFWNSTSTYWASAGISSTAKLGYTYPEFNDLDMGNKEAVRQAISKVVNELYGDDSSVLSSFPSTRHLLTAQHAAPAAALTVSAAAVAPARPPILAAPGGGHTIPDWSVRVHVKKYELNESFSVILFLGEVPENPDEWFSTPSYVGDHSVFVNAAVEQCENCRVQRELGIVTEGFVHLNKVIAARSGLSSLDEAEVVPYLKKNLHWRIRQADGKEYKLHNETSVEVVVFSVNVGLEPFSDSRTLPTLGKAHYYNAITAGRVGGAR